MADISEIILPNNAVYNIKDAYTRLQFSSNGNANRANSILYGKVDDTSTATAYTATIEGLDELVDGTTIMLHNGVVTSASGFTININDLGAKPCYNNMTNATRETTIFNIAYTMLFVYSTDLNNGNGGWWIYRGYDANTNTIGYQLRSNSSNKVASDTGYKYRLWLTSADGSKWVPINTSSSTNATTTRTLNTRPIDPFGPIVYRATNGTCNAGSGVGATGIWQQYTVTIGYSYMASRFSLSFPDSVYLRCTPQADGSAVMQDIVQALPTTKDGKIYIHLGTAYSATAMELTIEHPVYWYDGTGIRLWTGVAIPTKTSDLTNDSGFITSSDIPEGSAASTTSPKMDGTAAVGTEMAFARGDHVHPTDTSRQETLVSGTNIKTINNQSILGSGDLAIQEGTEMVVLKYGISTWADFEAAYPNAVVYCRASSNANPASGSQTRMAFMAYVNNETNPTNVEFQYYRSVSTKTATQQGDQVYIYKLDKTTGWSVTVREASAEITAGTGLTQNYASGVLTLSREDELPAVSTSDNGKILTVSNGDWAAVTPGTSVNGVKGDAESTYRTGNVNLTPGNLGAVSVSGDTMTGSLTIKDNNIDITTTPSSSQYDGIFEIHDSNDKQIMNITAIHTNNGYHGFSIGPYDSDTGQQNALQLTQNNNGNYRVWISQPTAWRSALGIGTIGTKNTLTASDIPSLDYLPLTGGTITENNNSSLILNSQSIKMIDEEGTTYFHVSDLRDASGVATIVNTFIGDGSKTSFYFSLPASNTDYSVTVDGVEVVSDITKQTSRIDFSTAPAAQSEIVVTYTTTSNLAKAYTLGIRASSSNIGSFSVAEGQNTTASGRCSHAEGYNTTASGGASHAEGEWTTASGGYSHAEGSGTIASKSGTHAEGGATTANGEYSHAEGFGTVASGTDSHAQNHFTIAAGDYQTALGKWNISDTTNAVIIGNGTSDTARSNAMTVDWNGNEVLAGGLTLGSPLTIANGGTGKTTATEAWTALGGGAIGKKATLSSADIPDNAANTSGNAGTATKLKTARSLYVALGTAYSSSSPVTFDGSAAKALPVNGTLAIAHGGTGKTTATEAWTALGGGAIGKKASLTAADLPTVPITKGGTGATTTANAQKALMGTANTDWAYLKGSANVTQYSRWRCKSGIVFVELYYTTNAGLSTTGKNFGTIPTGYRPNKEVDAAAYLGQNVLHFATMWVDTGGNVIAKTADGTSNSIYCSLSYPL